MRFPVGPGVASCGSCRRRRRRRVVCDWRLLAPSLARSTPLVSRQAPRAPAASAHVCWAPARYHSSRQKRISFAFNDAHPGARPLPLHFPPLSQVAAAGPAQRDERAALLRVRALAPQRVVRRGCGGAQPRAAAAKVAPAVPAAPVVAPDLVKAGAVGTARGAPTAALAAAAAPPMLAEAAVASARRPILNVLTTRAVTRPSQPCSEAVVRRPVLCARGHAYRGKSYRQALGKSRLGGKRDEEIFRGYLWVRNACRA